VVTYTESFVQKNESEQVIIQQLDALCNDLPLFGPQCQTIVAQYAPQLIAWIVNKENPQAFCAQVGLCSSTVKVQARTHHNHRMAHQRHSLVKHSLETEEQAACSICQLVVTYVEKWVAQNQTEQQIIQQLQAFCSNLGPLSPECSSFVSSYAPQIIAWLENKEPASTICAQLGVCSSVRKPQLFRANAVRNVKKDKRNVEQGACQICQLVVTYVENLIQQNNTVQEIEQKVDQMCTLLPSPINNLCTSIVNSYLPQLIQWLVNHENPQAFCSSVSLC
jgi:saposin